MRQISVDEALKRGRLLLVWTPLLMMFCCFGLAVFIISASNKNTFFIVSAVSIFICGFIVPWIWWSFQVVKWKIWAFTNVADIKSLEKRAIAAQLIWDHGNWFEKTEIKNNEEKFLLDKIYKKLETATVNREKVFDNSLPNQMVIKFPIANVFIWAGMSAVGVYLIYDQHIVIGTAVIIASGYTVFDLVRKIYKNQFLMKLDQNGVTLTHAFLPWNAIEDYYLEKSGFGNSTSFSIIIQGQDLYETISLSDINTNAFTIEKYMDVYRTRFELRNGVK